MNQKIKSSIQNLPPVIRYLLVLGVIAFISLLFPNNVKFKYTFQEGQSWQSEDLIAPFDFPIQKTAAEIQAERDQIEAEFSPYFELNSSVLRAEKSAFLAAFDQQIAQEDENSPFYDVIRRPERYKEFGLQILDKFYQKGIIATVHPFSQKEPEFVLNIIKGNTRYRQTLQNTFDKKAVLNWLIDSLPYASLREPEFLLPLMEPLFRPNLFYSEALTQRFKQEQLATISTTQGLVKKGDLIVPHNGIVTENIYQKLISYKSQYEKEVSKNKIHLAVFTGYFMLTSLIIGVLLFWMRQGASYILRQFNRLLFILMWIVLYGYLVYMVESIGNLSVWLIPFCIVPIIIKTFYDDQTAFFVHITIVLIASLLSTLGYEFTVLQILAGIVALLTSKETRSSSFFWSIFYIFLTFGLGYLGLALIREGNIYSIEWGDYPYLFVSVVLTLLAYPLIPLLERVFGFTSAIRLHELADLNRPLLKRLSLEAPGTLQHSLQVANLCEAAATEIGANQLLVKVAALYHDIGKIKNPLCFIENQSTQNLHDQLTEVESARLIIDHVQAGVKLAKKHRLPQELIDFIKTHHGTTRVEYFYRNFLKNHPEEPVKMVNFCYPGPKPHTKEQTLLMMADSIEAASKSLKNPSEEEISDLVDKIIEYKINNEQFTESTLSFAEMEACRRVFKQLLKSILHVRIEYPGEEG